MLTDIFVVVGCEKCRHRITKLEGVNFLKIHVARGKKINLATVTVRRNFPNRHSRVNLRKRRPTSQNPAASSSLPSLLNYLLTNRYLYTNTDILFRNFVVVFF